MGSPFRPWRSQRRFRATRIEQPALASLALCLATACTPAPAPEPVLSPSARPEVLASLREDLLTARGPQDGGGRAWLESEDATVVAGGLGRFELFYEAGHEGIDRGGMIFLQVSPFWDWSTPQLESPRAPGFTEVSTAAEGIELEPAVYGSQLLGIRVGGRELRPGERIRIVYGAGEIGARVDRYAERQSYFWFSVDGDGDGVRGLVPDPPAVRVIAGPPAQLLLLLPTTARTGETVHLTASVVDRAGNGGVAVEGSIHLRVPRGLAGPATVELTAADDGVARTPFTVREAGIYRIEAQGPASLSAVSNPLVVDDDGPRILWGDLHGHSGLSDGTGTPEDYFRYARDVAALDVVALTDHDHWGVEPLSRTPRLWDEIRTQTEAFHQPGRFVTLLGYEWTSWLHGHRHVLYFTDVGQVLSSVDPAYETPQQLWDALRGQPALTFAHHSAGGPIATNWSIPPDPELEPVTEIVSVHGSSEAMDSPGLIYSPEPGNFVRDALARGYQLGFIGSGDSHDGHPGLAGLASPSAGLAAILSEELTREGVLQALRDRRTYATNGPRIYLDVTWEGHAVGAGLTPADRADLRIVLAASSPLVSIEMVRQGRIERLAVDERERDVRLRQSIRDLEKGDYIYVRVVQEDGGTAWSSPFFFQ